MLTISILICLVAFFVLLCVLRRDRVSLGLPIAYLISLLLIHVPGAFAHAMSDGFLYGSEFVETGIEFTAFASIAFVCGVCLIRWRDPQPQLQRSADCRSFSLYCLTGGFVFSFALGSLRDIPSVAAAVNQGGAIWMIGVMLGLRASMERGNIGWAVLWLVALVSYPVARLLLGGFLSYGAAAAIIVCSVLLVSIRSRLRLAAGTVLAVFLGLTVFVNYFLNRSDIRSVVWAGAEFDQRIGAVANAGANFDWFDPTNRLHLTALNVRLNQNYFVGLAAKRIEQGEISYLYGSSLWEGLISLVPRAVWPDKPVFGGSGDIVRTMTGLPLSTTTSWGVGNVMEFHINFGMPGLFIGFLALGCILALLDRKAALAESRRDLGRTILLFLPAVALIQPNGSMVEMFGGAASAVVAAFGWKWGWEAWRSRATPTGRDTLSKMHKYPGISAPKYAHRTPPLSRKR